jgi:hypothetical protein
VDGSSTRHVSAMDVGAAKAPTIRRTQIMQAITTIGLDIANASDINTAVVDSLKVLDYKRLSS